MKHMRIDVAIIRDLMLGFDKEHPPATPNWTQEQVDFHTNVIRNDGLIEGSGSGSVTPKGREFINALRDDVLWGHLKQAIKDRPRASITLADIVKLANEIADDLDKQSSEN